MIPAKLVHDTGTMIRFRTSQLDDLPDVSSDIAVLLPSNRVVKSHFNRHPQNPNVSGAELVGYIKQRLTFGGREDILIERRTSVFWVVHLLTRAIAMAEEAHVPPSRVRRGALQPADLAKLMALADREDDRGKRLATYSRVLRPPELRRLMLGVVGTRCMVEACDASDGFDAKWGEGSGSVIVDVHHIEPVAHVIDHHPRNLCVLCANHHRFVHAWSDWSIHHDGPNVVLIRSAGEMVIERPVTLFPQA